MTGLRWSRRTTTTIAQELAQLGIAVSPNTVARLLHDMGYSLRVNQKQISTNSSPNRNLQFDEFTIEQLAGDLLPSATLDQQVASGFNRCNITTNEGGIIDEEYLVLYTRDRTETVSQVWLGLTAGCAVCHDHKFDPLTQKEFYEMAAFFNNNSQNAKDGNIKDTPPILFVPSAGDRDRWNTLSGLLAENRKQMETRTKAARPEFDKWLAQAQPKALEALDPNQGQRLKATLTDWDAKAPAAESAGTLEIADVGDFDTNQAFSCGAWVKFPKAGATGAVVSRMDDRDGFRGWDLWIDKGKLGTHIIHKWPDEAIKVVDITALKPGEWNHVLLTYDGTGSDKGVALYLNGKRQTAARTQMNNLRGTIRTDSAGISSTSPTICAIAVSEPWPMSTVPQ